MNLRTQVQRFVTGLHARIYRASKGRIAGSMAGAQVVLVTTTGRKSGVRRTTPLTVTPAGESVVLIASNGGADKHPDWYLNLVADPMVQVQQGEVVRTMKARVASEPERSELYKRAVAVYSGYAGYQAKTDRQIPVVVLEPTTMS